MRFILTLIIFIPLYACAQPEVPYECSCDTIYSQVSDEIESLKAVILSDNIQDKRYLACCYHCLGVKYQRTRKYEDANKQYKKAIDIRRENNFGGLAKSCRNLGYSCKVLGLYHKAIFWINEAIQADVKEKDILNSHVYLASSYISIGEFEKAENSLKIAFRLAKSHEEKAKVNNTSCILHLERGAFQEAVEYAEKAASLFKKIKSDDSAKAENNRGNAYRKLGNYNEAIKSYNSSIEVYQRIGSTLAEAQTLNNIAAALYGQKKYKEGINTLNKSLELKKKHHESTSFKYTYAANHENLAENYEVLGDIDKALTHYQLALQNLTNNFRQKDIHQNPTPNDSNLYIYNKIDFIRVLHLKASAAFKKYQQKGDSAYLNLAEKTYNTAFQFHDQLPKQITTQASRLFQAEVIVPFIENALAVAYELQQTQQKTPETAYRFMEKNKASVLMQAINEKGALQYAGLPDSLLNQEKDLRETITAYEKQLNDARQYEEKDKAKQYEDLLFEQKNTYDQLIQNLEKNHPEYYNLKYKQNTSTLKDVQNYLDSETALLEYFVGDSSIYVLAIEKNTAHLHRLEKPENWNNTISDFRTSISDADTQLSFVPHAHQLYKWLIPKPNPKIKRLQIIPDAQLNYLPFGLLLTEDDSQKTNYDLSYLLKQYSISYAYSAALLLEEKERQDKTQYLYGGFAPEYDGTEHDNLPEGFKNVEAQTQKLKGKAFLANQATKTQFQEHADQFQILHLSMHGILDDENPLYSKLIFADSALHAADLYNTRLNADLAILSACNTGTGEIKKGEGVMSLSRAFTYAGCPSLLMSLWSVPDGGTADVVDIFLEELKKGETKDKALQNAQLTYLTNASTTQHPTYWAGLVPSGSMQAVKFDSNCNWWWAILLLLCVMLYVGRRIIKNDQI